MTALQILDSDPRPASVRTEEPTSRRTPTSPAKLRALRGRRRALLPVVGGQHRPLEVPLVDGRTVPYANLDYAASAPCLETVDARLQEILPYYASVHRGAGYASQVSTALYEGSRAEIARFLGARADDVVVFTRNTTDALNLLATAVPTGGDGPSGVLHLDVEHHANLLPWQRTESRCLPAGTTQRGTLIALRAELAARPAALVAVTGASNVTGEVLPIDRIVRVAHEFGARVAVDAAQLAPHRRIDLEASGVDYVALSGHKLYAPLGSGVLVGRRDWLDAAPVYLAGGGAVRSVELDHTEWADAPARHEGGTPNVLGAVALAQAVTTLAGLDDGALEEHENDLRTRLVQAFDAREGVRVHRIWRDSPDAVGVVAFTVEGYDPGLVAAYLSAEHGIGVRDGKFCAHPLLKRLGTAKGALRASFGVGSTTEDVDRLIAAVDALLTDGPAWEYAVVDGRHAPTPDPRTWPGWLGGSAGGTAPDGTVGAAGLSPCEE